jgi:hypothetical protein
VYEVASLKATLTASQVTGSQDCTPVQLDSAGPTVSKPLHVAVNVTLLDTLDAYPASHLTTRVTSVTPECEVVSL